MAIHAFILRCRRRTQGDLGIGMSRNILGGDIPAPLTIPSSRQKASRKSLVPHFPARAEHLTSHMAASRLFHFLENTTRRVQSPDHHRQPRSCFIHNTLLDLPGGACLHCSVCSIATLPRHWPPDASACTAQRLSAVRASAGTCVSACACFPHGKSKARLSRSHALARRDHCIRRRPR